MKQKIIIKVQVKSSKCRSKALKIVAAADGEIFSFAWEGEDMDKMVVVGDEVNAVKLTTKLEKKLGSATLVESSSKRCPEGQKRKAAAIVTVITEILAAIGKTVSLYQQSQRPFPFVCRYFHLLSL
ncbi:hypothetical protein EZV62_008912 [Acer yangbiense]|uniref:HMA domain-containing protein n=1 Tax=Acer yangbiense TaxID=1000413 RepID=A0A5C7IE91_9ROSI|nr:hypothetical protein EZV62_008912 [Acer yangbiense]